MCRWPRDTLFITLSSVESTHKNINTGWLNASLVYDYGILSRPNRYTLSFWSTRNRTCHRQNTPMLCRKLTIFCWISYTDWTFDATAQNNEFRLLFNAHAKYVFFICQEIFWSYWKYPHDFFSLIMNSFQSAMSSKTPLSFDTNKFQAPDAPMFTQFRPTCETGTSFVTWL